MLFFVDDLLCQGSKALLAVMLFAGSGYLGVSCVAALTKRFGALLSAITTTARKVFTLLLSFAMFPNKPFSAQHAVGAAVFILGLVVSYLLGNPFLVCMDREISTCFV